MSPIPMQTPTTGARTRMLIDSSLPLAHQRLSSRPKFIAKFHYLYLVGITISNGPPAGPCGAAF